MSQISDWDEVPLPDLAYSLLDLPNEKRRGGPSHSHKYPRDIMFADEILWYTTIENYCQNKYLHEFNLCSRRGIYRFQCGRCGKCLSTIFGKQLANILKQTLNEVPFNEELASKGVKAQIVYEKQNKTYAETVEETRAREFLPVLFGHRLVMSTRNVSQEVYNAYIQSDQWKKKRNLIWKRDKHACRLCGLKPILTELCVHHCTYERLMNEEENDLITLCRNCHKLFHFGVVQNAT
jgi:hypothetical protein